MRNPTKPATYADLEALPENVIGQLIEGSLVVMPRPGFPHASLTTNLGIDLGNSFGRGRGGPGGWVFIDEPELHFGADVLVPDLAAWRRERFTPPTTSFFSTPPDWICEVLSPSTASYDRIQKRRIYATQKVAFLWLIDPVGRTLEAYRNEGVEFRELATWGGDEDDRVRVPPFDAIELELQSLWPPAT